MVDVGDISVAVETSFQELFLDFFCLTIEIERQSGKRASYMFHAH